MIDPADRIRYYSPCADEPQDHSVALEMFASANLRLSQDLDPMGHEEARKDLATAIQQLR